MNYYMIYFAIIYIYIRAIYISAVYTRISMFIILYSYLQYIV